MRKNIGLFLLLLSHIITPSSAQNTSTTSTNISLPVDVSVFVGDPAVLSCGGPKTSAVTFTLFGGHGNYSLTCPGGHVEDIPQAVYGSCHLKQGQSLAVWTIRGTSNSDNNTRAVCQLPNGFGSSTATLRVYDNGMNTAILIGCVIGAFFGTVLAFALCFIFLQRSETFQKCFRGKEEDDDTFSIISKDFSKQKKNNLQADN
ncbi:uncharacterized protein LOC133501170 [Syngnathoides biaculeatus]|uniref:uncharacterized protein LOC133501170 n=1 Tax=Syngnathoides biaculeatus TaxID=300417 RepID=UPI002ADDF96F|nr:uncharacterized protein LOC133501170 [Syngnathoides biaculeatus]